MANGNTARLSCCFICLLVSGEIDFVPDPAIILLPPK
jgi:hypothetical protein